MYAISVDVRAGYLEKEHVPSYSPRARPVPSRTVQVSIAAPRDGLGNDIFRLQYSRRTSSIVTQQKIPRRQLRRLHRYQRQRFAVAMRRGRTKGTS